MELAMKVPMPMLIIPNIIFPQGKGERCLIFFLLCSPPSKSTAANSLTEGISSDQEGGGEGK